MKNKKLLYGILIVVLLMAGIILCRTFTEIIPPIEPEPSEEPKEGFCGQSTYGKCLTDLDCTKEGCSGEVCQSKNEESIITPCVFRECYNAETYSMQCKCVNEQCQWYKYPRE